jgi:hypothetical protein
MTGAAYILASMYEHGDGVQRCRPAAWLRWYVEASAGGDPAARLKAEEIRRSGAALSCRHRPAAAPLGRNRPFADGDREVDSRLLRSTRTFAPPCPAPACAIWFSMPGVSCTGTPLIDSSTSPGSMPALLAGALRCTPRTTTPCARRSFSACASSGVMSSGSMPK